MTIHPFRVAVIFGTRPEAIKLAPVIRAFSAHPQFETLTISTAQHRGLLDQVLDAFQIEPAVDLDLMQPDQSLADLAGRALMGLTRELQRVAPDLVIVQGDTTTAMMGALGAFYVRVPVAHVEAGLRSFDKDNPYPEEGNRRIISQLTDLHYAPTEGNRKNLLAEGVPDDAIVVTGNSVIDALLQVSEIVDEARFRRLVGDSAAPGRLVLVTVHRRESFGQPLKSICAAIRRLVDAHDDLQVLFPVHPNPNVREVVFADLGNHDRIHLVEPLGYLDFVAAVKYATLILTDSGGIQEEAPSLGKPVLVLREVTERPEGVEAGVVEVVGRDPDHVVKRAERLLGDEQAYLDMTRRVNPYGDGHAAERMVEAALSFLDSRARRGAEPAAS